MDPARVTVSASGSRRRRFPFRLEGLWRLAVLPFGVTARRAYVDLDGAGVHARFGPWRMDVPMENIARWAIRGPYRWWRAVGVRQTIGVWDLSFGSSAKDGVYLEFVSPQHWGGNYHPALTVTVADPVAFGAALAERGIPGTDERSRPTA
ncbi:MAG TPA: hypothetical protein VFI28_08465 [Candidatus Limnocylindrales bacterium]|nr:hypothetical protein [Candidatus Limnocylindrales bacterium]